MKELPRNCQMCSFLIFQTAPIVTQSETIENSFMCFQKYKSLSTFENYIEKIIMQKRPDWCPLIEEFE
jgi:hypothetical protein